MPLIDLDLETLPRTYHRVVVKPRDAEWASEWQVLPVGAQVELGSPLTATGYRVLRYSRQVLPAIGEAFIAYDFGTFNGTSYSPQDLTGYDVRIQAWRGSDSTEKTVDFLGAGWRTVWWGVIEYFTDDLSRGVRTYRAIDGLASRARKWLLDEHQYLYAGSGRYCPGAHPGYNKALSDGRVVGDRGASDPGKAASAYTAHTYPGTGTLWTDLQAAENALAIHRTNSDPQLTFTGAVILLGGSEAWGAPPGTTAWDMLVRICDRRRGRGNVFLDYDDDSGAPIGKLTVRLRVKPQIEADTEYVQPSAGTTIKLIGATTHGSAKDVNLHGDQRLVPGSLKIGHRHEHSADRVEVYGAPIQVLVTLAYADSTLEKRWTDAEATAFAALDPSGDAMARLSNRWSPVYRLHGLPRNWGGGASTGVGGSSARADYRCNDAGQIVVPAGAADVNPSKVKVLRDLPLYVGVDYSTSTPVRYDAESSPDLHRERVKLLAFADSEWVDLMTKQITAQVTPDGLLIFGGSDLTSGNRKVGDTAVTNLGSTYDVADLAVTVGLEFEQHRLFMAAKVKDRANARRVVRINLPDLHLWLAHPDAIWSFSATDGTIQRQAGGATATTPGILRDDRDRLARTAMLAGLWYLPERRSLSYALEAIGTLSDEDGDTDWPGLGDLIGTLSYTPLKREYDFTSAERKPEEAIVNTPVTQIEVDVQNNRTTWTTDWQEIAL